MADSIREKRSAAAAEVAAIMNNEEISDADFKRAEELDAEITSLDSEIESKTEAMKANAERALARPTIEIAGAGRMNDGTELDSFMRWFRSSGKQERALNTGDDPQVVPTVLADEMIRKRAAVSAVRQMPAVSVVNYENDTELSAVNARMTVGLVAEGTAITNTEPTFRTVNKFLGLSSKVQTHLTDEIIADSRPDIVQEVLLQQAEGHGLFWESQYVASTGYDSAVADRSEGIMVLPAQYVTAGWLAGAPNQNAVLQTYDASTPADKVASIVAAKAAKVPAQYWNAGGNWLMGQEFYAEILGMTDTTGRPIFQPNFDSSGARGLEMGSLFGDPVFVTSEAPDIDESGDLLAAYVSSGTFRIADRGSYRSFFDPYTHSGSGKVAYISSMRSDSRFLTKGEGISYLVRS
tara:strand:+ start:323 stop:1546 length:1224 start_codon:yes stop_codon:yes gene_type:complete